MEVAEKWEGGVMVCIVSSPSQLDKRREEREGGGRRSEKWRNIDSSLLSIRLFIACREEMLDHFFSVDCLEKN